MKLKEVIAKIEERIAIRQAESFDNVGLLCGNKEREVTGILVCHDALESVVDEAIAQKTNLIVCFHPIIFSGLKSLTGKNYVERAVIKAIENKIAIYAIHTAFDNDYFGVNYQICNELGLVNQKILMPKKQNLQQLVCYVPKKKAEQVKSALFDAGAGNIGFYQDCSFQVKGKGGYTPIEGANPYAGKVGAPEKAKEYEISVIFEAYKQAQVLSAMKKAHPYEEVAYQVYSLENDNQYTGLGRFGDLEKPMDEKDFLQMVKDKFNLEIIRHSELLGKKIKRVGVLGGSGASGIKSARANKCDIYLTGDVKYHDFFQSENQMVIADIGHFESERFVVHQLFEILSEKFTKFAVLESIQKTNPVNYFI
ncbi:MAG: Nif3-like dinuclear metal center hexameric protein [Flavobacteriales bacterium]|nr:MAG: Nif3-like dinuclear metal center hexameric protein [Flavobacteriales bacterium]